MNKRIAIIGKNSAEYINLVLDIWNQNDVVVLIDWRMPPAAINNIIEENNIEKCYIDNEVDNIEEYVKNELDCDFRYGCDIEYNGNNLDLILSKDEYLEFINNKKNLLGHMMNLYYDCLNISHNNCKELRQPY